jgi:hypothetical protein
MRCAPVLAIATFFFALTACEEETSSTPPEPVPCCSNPTLPPQPPAAPLPSPGADASGPVPKPVVRAGRWRFCDGSGDTAGELYDLTVEGTTITMTRATGTAFVMKGAVDPATRIWKARYLSQLPFDGGTVEDGFDATLDEAGEGFTGETFVDSRLVDGHVEDGVFQCPDRRG